MSREIDTLVFPGTGENPDDQEIFQEGPVSINGAALAELGHSRNQGRRKSAGGPKSKTDAVVTGRVGKIGHAALRRDQIRTKLESSVSTRLA